MDDNPPSIGRLAARGVAWSIVQSWGGRLITFLLFVLLARFLEPAVFGVASAAVIILGLVTMVAEFGFSDAIVQRRDLEPADVDLPFLVSIASAVALAAACIAAAGTIETRLGVAGLAPVLSAMVMVAPVTIVARYQETTYRRALRFRDLAFRVLIANVVAGSIAAICAAAGAGVWSLVAQNWIAAGVGLVWLWSRPQWRPSLTLRPRSFLALARFGLPLTALRLAEFASVRFYEMLLISRHGIAAYGLYAVGARLYETLLGLLQGAIGEVSLTILSRISQDRERLAEAYLRTLLIAGFLTAPAFVAVAALLPEISAVLFGDRWSGVDAIALPLMLLGAAQALYFFNASFLAARGRTGVVAGASIAKSLCVPIAVVLVPTGDVVSLVRVFALALLIEAPLSFAATLRELNLPLGRLARNLLPPAVGCVAAWFAVAWARPEVHAVLPGPFLAGLALGFVFAGAFAAVAGALGFRRIAVIWRFVRDRVGRGRGERD